MTTMTCPHRPTSNGWSGGTSVPPQTYCGRCHEYVTVDVAWADTYYGKKLVQLENDLARRREQAVAELHRDHVALVKMIETGGEQ